MTQEHFVETNITDVFTFTREDINEIISAHKKFKGIIINSIKKEIRRCSISINYNCSENCLDSVIITVVYKDCD